MLAVPGYYDGAAFQALEHAAVKPNQRVIITIMDDFVDSAQKADAKRLRKIEKLCGSLADYANPSLIEKEKGAWERAVVEKYGNL